MLDKPAADVTRMLFGRTNERRPMADVLRAPDSGPPGGGGIPLPIRTNPIPPSYCRTAISAESIAEWLTSCRKQREAHCRVASGLRGYESSTGGRPRDRPDPERVRQIQVEASGACATLWKATA